MPAAPTAARARRAGHDPARIPRPGSGIRSYFIEHYIIPMGAAIWSSRPVDMLHFPARFFVEFFANHGFLSVNDRPDLARDPRRLA